MKKRALLLIDLQQEYLAEGKLPLEGIEQAAAKAKHLLEYHRQLGDKIVHIHHLNRQANASIFIANSAAIQPIQGLQPSDNETVVNKPRPNAFVDTPLQQILQQDNISELTIVGAMSHMCIEATTRAAVDLGFNCTVIADACATRELEFNDLKVSAEQVHATSMAALAFAYAKVISMEQYSGLAN